jgi:hypothetical protein
MMAKHTDVKIVMNSYLTVKTTHHITLLLPAPAYAELNIPAPLQEADVHGAVTQAHTGAQETKAILSVRSSAVRTLRVPRAVSTQVTKAMHPMRTVTVSAELQVYHLLVLLAD